MIKRSFISAAVLALTSTFVLTAQNKPRYELVEERNLYLNSGNICGMRADSVNISNATVAGSYVFGNNRNSYEAPSAWNAGIIASSIMHRQKMSLYGNFRFRHTAMYGACSSMFIEPGRYPVDILEFTPGGKSKQDYGFVGGISADVASAWRIGARVDFSASNYVKTKDLRYTDFALNLSLRPGFQWVSGDMTLGAAFAIERNTETIKAEQVADSNIEYDVFFDKGLGYGIFQDWKGGGVHLSEAGVNGFPVMEVGIGASAQISYKGIFAELAFLHSDGKMGEKDAVWFKFPANKLGLDLAWQGVSGRRNLHTVRASVVFKHTDLREAVMDKVTEGGVTNRFIYAYNDIYSGDNWSFTPSWTMVREDSFDLRVEASYKGTNAVSTLYYPYAAHRRLHMLRVAASGRVYLCRSVLLGLGIWGGKGFLDDGMRMIPSDIEGNTEPYRYPSQYENWTMMNTMLNVGGELSVRYIFKNNMYLQPQISSDYRNRNHRTNASLAFGYNF